MKLPIRQFDPFNCKKQDLRLRQKTHKIVNLHEDNVIQCMEDLNDTLNDLLYSTCENIEGLAAPQIGYSFSICAVQIRKKRYILINPVIVNHSDRKRLFKIDSLSLCGYRALIRYYDRVMISYTDKDGIVCTLTVEDEVACTIQYLMDHLLGILPFDRLENNKYDLFFPREKIYGNNVPLKNYGLLLNIRKKLNLIKVQTTTQYYSFLFDYTYDYRSYVINSVKKRHELVDIIIKYGNRYMKILEAGCGTSSISVFLSKIGYNLVCVDNNSDMLELAKTINGRCRAQVHYTLGDIKCLNYRDKEFGLVFSHGVLEHFNDKEKVKIIDEGLRLADIYIISIPTIWDISNNLLGDEILWTINRWKKFLMKNGYDILEIIKFFPTTPLLGEKYKAFKMLPAGNVIFVISQKRFKN